MAGTIFYVMGKSASGKDTIFKELVQRLEQLKTVRMYTTRPIRSGEQDGVEYYFADEAFLSRCEKEGKLVECRTYQTVCGPWSYFTVDDGQIDLSEGDYLMIGTLESYEKTREYYGKENVEPLYIWVEDGLRLLRALERERSQQKPNYEELCRRFLADARDFSEENLRRCGIGQRYENQDLEKCLEKICQVIKNKCKK